MDGLAIDLRDVAKTYGRTVRALRGIRMEVRPGEIFGLLGPNGAGKSTLVKIMMTVIRPSLRRRHAPGPADRSQTHVGPRRLPAGTPPDPALPHQPAGAGSVRLAVEGRPPHPQSPHRGAAGVGRHDFLGRRPHRHLLQGHAAADRPGPGDGPRSRPDRPGRAHRRPGPGRPPRGPPGARATPRSGQNRVPQQPPARRVGAGLRPCGHPPGRGGHPPGNDRRADRRQRTVRNRSRR